MKVRAIKRGFLGGIYRRPGDRFDCPPDSFSLSWMEEYSEGMEPLATEDYKPLEIPNLLAKKRKKPTKSSTLSLKK